MGCRNSTRLGIYGARILFFVSARTNKRHHHPAPSTSIPCTQEKLAAFTSSRVRRSKRHPQQRSFAGVASLCLIARPGSSAYGPRCGRPPFDYLFVFPRLALEHCRSHGMLVRLYTKLDASLSITNCISPLYPTNLKTTLYFTN